MVVNSKEARLDRFFEIPRRRFAGFCFGLSFGVFVVLGILFISLVPSSGLSEVYMKREETVALLKELGAEHLIQPSFVLIDRRKPDSYELKIKGVYNLQDVEIFLRNKFSVEESKDYLVIFGP